MGFETQKRKYYISLAGIADNSTRLAESHKYKSDENARASPDDTTNNRNWK